MEPAIAPAAQRAVARVVDRAREVLGADLLGAYLHGSAVLGGLRPESDLDVLLLGPRGLTAPERTELLALLLRISGRRAAEGPARPLEVTVVAQPDVVPWRYPPSCDLQYGEWLRDDALAGSLLDRHTDADLAVVLTSARQNAVALTGPPLAELLDPVPPDDLRRAIHDSLPALLADLGHPAKDERNVLLTLARMVATLDNGTIVPKDVAVRQVLPDLPTDLHDVLELAAAAYRREAVDDWDVHAAAAQTAAAQLAQLVILGGGARARVVVLVEGTSDAAVVRHLAGARGLPDDGSFEVLPMGGVTNVARSVTAFGQSRHTTVVILCDAAEEWYVRRALETVARRDGRAAEAAPACFVCDRDLEDELIRSVGPAAVEDALDELGDLARFRTFQNQPEWRGRPLPDQLHRFAGSRSGRKAALAEQLAARLTPEATPAPLAALLDEVERHLGGRVPTSAPR